MNVVWSRRAVRHLTRVRDCIAEDDPKALEETARQILESAERLVANPHIRAVDAGRPSSGDREHSLLSCFDGPERAPASHRDGPAVGSDLRQCAAGLCGVVPTAVATRSLTERFCQSPDFN